MPGSVFGARKALELYTSKEYRCESESPTDPINISDECDGGASYRSVFRFSNVVYKIATCNGEMYEEMNVREHDFFSEYSDSSWSSPTSLFTVEDKIIICMPYYEARYTRDNYQLRAIISPLWIDFMRSKYSMPEGCSGDFHYGNFREEIATGLCKLVDAGGMAWRRGDNV